MMLLNNESLEEAIQDQQIEYEERIAELEGLLTEKYENDDEAMLRQKDEDASEMITTLVKDDFKGQEPSRAHDVEYRTRINDTNLNLGHDLSVTAMAKNAAISDATSVTFENSQTDDEGQRVTIRTSKSLTHIVMAESHDFRAPFSEHDLDSPAYRAEMNSILPPMICEKNSLDYRPSQLMDNAEQSQNTTQFPSGGTPQVSPEASINKLAIIPAETNAIIVHQLDAEFAQGIMVTSPPGDTENIACDLSTPQTISPDCEIEKQVKKLITENGKLAQRLGNAVADKECM